MAMIQNELSRENLSRNPEGKVLALPFLCLVCRSFSSACTRRLFRLDDLVCPKQLFQSYRMQSTNSIGEDPIQSKLMHNSTARGHPPMPPLSLNGIGNAKGTRPTSARPVSAVLTTDRLRPQTARAQVGCQCLCVFCRFSPSHKAFHSLEEIWRPDGRKQQLVALL